MTRNKDLKNRVRARMSKTGERYTAARARVLERSTRAEATPGPASAHGAEVAAERRHCQHQQTHAMAQLLEAAGIVAPHTGQPYSEAMLLGLGGGIGAAYFVFEYQGHLPHLYVETRCTPQYPYSAAFLTNIVTHLGVSFNVHETGATQAAAKQLSAALASGLPVIAWVDMGALPYMHEPAAAQGQLPHVVVVHSIDSGQVSLSDLSEQRFSVAEAEFASARKQLRKAKHRLLSVAADAPAGDLAAAVRTGMRECSIELAGRSPVKGYKNNFGLPSLVKWADLVANTSNKKGWPKVFRRGAPLFVGLRRAYFWIENAGTGGCGFRSMYAAFLAEAADVLGDDRVAELAQEYQQIAGLWGQLSATLLPRSVPALAKTRSLLDRRRHAFRTLGPDAVAEVRNIDQQLDSLQQTMDEQFPMSEDDVRALYADLERELRDIINAETNAAETLRQLSM